MAEKSINIHLSSFIRLCSMTRRSKMMKIPLSSVRNLQNLNDIFSMLLVLFKIYCVIAELNAMYMIISVTSSRTKWREYIKQKSSIWAITLTLAALSHKITSIYHQTYSRAPHISTIFYQYQLTKYQPQFISSLMIYMFLTYWKSTIHALLIMQLPNALSKKKVKKPLCQQLSYFEFKNMQIIRCFNQFNFLPHLPQFKSLKPNKTTGIIPFHTNKHLSL